MKEKECRLDNVKEKKELEFSAEELEQIDAIENSVFNLCSILLNKPDLDWDMSMIGDIADAAADILVSKGYKVYYPAIVEDENHNEIIVGFYQN